MNSKYFIFFVLGILFGYPSFGQDVFRSIEIDSDTIKSSWIKDQIVINDSIKILEYQKIKYNSMPDIVDERVVYVDLQKSILSEEIKKYRDQLKSIFHGESYLMIQKNSENEDIINPYNEISDTYIQIHKLNNKYILFLPEFDHLRVISDSAFMYKDDEGLLFYYFHNINKEDDFYEIKYRDFQHNISSKKIQSYDKNKKIQVWKEIHIGANNKEFINYRLYIPLSEAINYPILNFINTGGLDEVYNNFDRIGLESLF